MVEEMVTVTAFSESGRDRFIRPTRLAQDDDFSNAHLAAVVSIEVLQGKWYWAGKLGWQQWGGRSWQQAPKEVLREEVRQYLMARHCETLEVTHRLRTRLEDLTAQREQVRRDGGQMPSDTEIEDLRRRLSVMESRLKRWYATLSHRRIVAISNLTRNVLCQPPTEPAASGRPSISQVE